VKPVRRQKGQALPTVDVGLGQNRELSTEVDDQVLELTVQ
jgi:hypothetical protein